MPDGNSASGSPYSASLVTIAFSKTSERVAFQVTDPAVLGRLPAVGEKVQAQDKTTNPPRFVDGIVQHIVTGYFADTALGITIDIQIA